MRITMDPYRETINTFNKHASGYQQKYMDVSHYGEGLDKFVSPLRKGSKVLEIGCGPGNITSYLLARRPDLDILGIDPAPNMIALAKQNNAEATFLEMDAREIEQIEDKFEAVICGFVLPYLSRENVDKLITDCFRLMHSNGLFYLSTMEDDYSKSGYQVSSDGQDRCYMYFHHADDLRIRLERGGFEVQYLKKQAFPPSGVQLATDLIIIARKKG